MDPHNSINPFKRLGNEKEQVIRRLKHKGGKDVFHKRPLLARGILCYFLEPSSPAPRC